MADMWAGHNLKSAPTHPGFEAEFQVLSAPDVKSRVVSAKLLKEGPVNGKEPTWNQKSWLNCGDGDGDDGDVDGGGDGDGDGHLPLWDYVLEPKYSLGASPHVQELHACQQDFL